MGASLTDILSLVVVYGYPVICILNFCGTIGLPVPLTAILLAAGSLAGAGILQLYLLIPFIATSAVLGDIASYYIGKRVGVAALEHHRIRDSKAGKTIATAEYYFSRWAGISIFLSRWLFTPFGTIVNLLAGIGNYPIKTFLLLDIIGELICATLFTGIGYFLGTSWVFLWNDIKGIPTIVLGITLSILVMLYAARKLYLGLKK